MRKSAANTGPTDYPEYAVRAEAIGRFFTPPLASRTFHDLVKKGKIIPMKDMRGFYLLNASLRRLGLREVAPGRTMKAPRCSRRFQPRYWRAGFSGSAFPPRLEAK